MSISFLKCDKIDKAKWNQAVAASLYPTLFADYDFLSVASPEWCALIKGDYEYIMPLPVRSRMHISYIFTPFQFSRLGIFSKNRITAEIVREFFQAIPSNFKQIDLRLNHYNPSEKIASESIQLVSYSLNLKASYTELYKNFRQNTKRNIKAAEKENLHITSDLSLRDIVLLYKENRGKTKKFKIKGKDYRLFLKIATFAQERGFLELVGVKDGENNLLAGAAFLHDYSTVWFWFSGRDNRFANKRAMFFLINEYIKKYQKTSKILDFDGSMNENIARFYAGFGATRYSFPMLYFSRHFYLHKLVAFYKIVRGL